MLNPNETAFLRAIATKPDDLTGRLVFADWLEDHGEANRAEFIRIQCELKSATLPEENRQSLGRRERELLDLYRQVWCQAFQLPIEDVRFDCGLVAAMRLAQWENGRMLDPTFATRIAPLKELDLSRLQIGDEGLTTFAAQANFPALQKLILSGNEITDAGATALSQATGLPRLETVYLFQNSTTTPAREMLQLSSHFSLQNLDVGERPDGYSMSPGEAEVARREYVRATLLPLVARYFHTYQRLQSAMLCVAQYWADEADDAVHAVLIVSELFEPTLVGVGRSEDETPDPNLPTTHIKSRYSDRSSSEVSLWEAGADWSDNTSAIPLWAAFAPEGGTQEYNTLSECYAPAVLFYRHGGYIMLPMCRPHLNGVRPEWEWEG